MVTRVHPATIPAGQIEPLNGNGVVTATLAAQAGRCAMCVGRRAIAGAVDPVCGATPCHDRFYALPLEQRNDLRRAAGTAVVA